MASNNTAAAAEVMDHLYGLGHVRVGVITGPLASPLSADRLAGVRAAAARHGQAAALQVITGDFTIESGLHQATALLAGQDRPTAIFCFSDEMAMGALEAIRRAGLSCPRDVSLVGFDDIRFAEYLAPQLTTVSQPMDAIGHEVVRLLLDILKGRATTLQQVTLPHRLVVRASTAAPTYFPPEVVTLGKGKDAYDFVFVDGGVTTYNNAAFLAFQTVTAAPYRIQWQTGPDRMLIVSVGTGSAPAVRPGLKPDDMWLLDAAKTVPGALMNAAAAGWDMACRVLGECRFGRPIDQEVGDLVGSDTFSGAKQFAYVRYDPDVSQPGLNALGLADVKAADVQTLDAIDHIPDIQRVGKAFAARHVDVKQHLRGFL